MHSAEPLPQTTTYHPKHESFSTTQKNQKNEALRSTVLLANATKKSPTLPRNSLDTLFKSSLTLKTTLASLKALCLQTLQKNLPSLTEVTISKSNLTLCFTNRPLLLLTRTRSKLDLSNIKIAESLALKIFGSYCSNLSDLTLNGPEVIDSSLEYFSLNILQTLDLSDTRICNKALEIISRVAVQLTALVLSHTLVSTDGIVNLKKLTNLSALSLKECPEVDDQALMALASKDSVLDTIILDGCNKITEKGLWNFVSAHGAIEGLSATNCPHIHLGLALALQNSSNAHASFIQLDLASSLSPMALAILFKTFSQRRQLIIDNCERDDTFQMMLSALSQTEHDPLVAVVIRKYTLDIQEAIKSLGLSQPQLQTLALKGPIPKNTLEAITTHLPNLKNIILDEELRGQITDTDLELLAKNFPDLQEIGLAALTKITIRGIEILLTHCKAVFRLYIDECPNLGEKELEELKSTYSNTLFS